MATSCSNEEQSSKGSILQFAPFSSALDVGFWHQLSEKKLNEYQLDDKPRALKGYYTNSDANGLPCRMNLDFDAFDVGKMVPNQTFSSSGLLINTNTNEAFKTYDKRHLMESVAQQLWKDIVSGKAIDSPELLNRFLLLTYADLKKYHYHYWFCFPALCPTKNCTLLNPPTPLEKEFNSQQIKKLQDAYDGLTQDGHTPGFFLIRVKDSDIQVGHLKDWENFFSEETQVMIGFSDPCTLEKNPGWPLRNFLALIAIHWGQTIQSLKILCWRDRWRYGKRDSSHSIVVEAEMPSYSTAECPKTVGWEKNSRQKLGPRMVDLSSSMDPTKLAESSVDLNLRLMRWRLLPELDLETISKTRCLLLGAGTLGCNVARCLMGWGVRTITLVDNSHISYSNPVRQSLFEFEDCKNGGKPKAEAAAESLRKIFPGVNATGVPLTIPMPGHPVSATEEEQVRKDIIQLDEIIENHDVLFLLLDTRESRWLPTVMAAAKQKIAVTAALGFDTFLVMRHGVKSGNPPPLTANADVYSKIVHGSDLGCYFCNDVVAPGDSTRDRTLDQQCTVSRPGMSFITSALAVELLMSVLQHPQQGLASADSSANDSHISAELTSSLGLVPHQIRGFLSRFHVVLPVSYNFDKCTACSEMVVERFKTEGISFLLQAFNVPKYLEDLTGLTELHNNTNLSEIWELDSDEEVVLE